MQLRYVKDFAIILIVLAIIALGGRLLSLNRSVKKVPDKSVYSKESVSDSLLNKIKGIEQSIQERKNFVFSINRDPLRQGNIIKDRFDQEKEFMDMVKNTFRLSSTSVTDFGQKIATIEYQDMNYYARVGDVVEGRKIVDIGDNWMRYYYGGSTYTVELAPRPNMPDFSQVQKSEASGNY